eukprot:4511101-Amphidinium_carterae.1
MKFLERRVSRELVEVCFCLTYEDYVQANLELDQRVASLSWKLLLEWFVELSLTHLWYTMPPLSFLQLQDPEMAVSVTLERFKNEWSSLMAMEATARTDKEVSAFLSGVIVSKRTYCRKMYLRLAEKEFTEVPADVAADLLKQSESHGST